MRRRGKTGGKTSKTPRRNAQKVVRRSQAVGQEAEVARLTRELREALEQQKASAEILSVISSSAADTQPVFEKILVSCKHLFGGDELSVLLVDKQDQLIIAAYLGDYYDVVSPTFPTPVERAPIGRAIRERRVLHWPDVINGDVPAVVRKTAEIIGYRSMVFAPMLWENRGIGAIGVARSTGPFKPKELAILKTFADQAVIAIENTRLLNELRQRTNDLSESLEQQTATSEVLKVISSSPGELEPVFQAMLEQATHICEAKFGIVVRYEGGLFHPVATLDLPPALGDFMVKQGGFAPKPGQLFGRLCESKTVINVVDRATDPEPSPSYRYGGARSSIAVPMLKDDELLGAFFIYRTEVRPFTDKQIELVKNFAAQAVIAIENTRLLKELRQRTNDLTESLEQQTATSEVLQIISKSPGELKPVFEAMLASAVRICGAKFGNLWLCEGSAFRVTAMHGAPTAYADYLRINSVIRNVIPGTALGRIVSERRAIQILDAENEKAYAKGTPFYTGTIELARARTIIAVPLLKDEELVGAIVIFRQEVRPFTDKQIDLLTSFAAQAVIAIENARLLNELRQRTHELAASLDDLRTTQDRLVQTQKLALLGQLTAGIAHEIKNPLNFVNNFSGISADLIDELQDTLKGIPLDDKTRAEINELTGTLKGNFDKVVHHGKRADAIVKNMLQHSREGSGEHRAVDINALVEESLNLAWHGARAETQGFEIKLKQSFDPSAGEADIFPQDIRRALLNIISNGFYAATRRSAATNGGDYEPTITASTKNLGDRVEISIHDNGTGMPPDVKEKMFNPFFTTKPTGEGTGLGLSISHDIIVKQHGGSIEVDTQPGDFSEIRVVLPRVAAFV